MASAATTGWSRSRSSSRGTTACKLSYDGGDKLFVPVENIDVLSRYGAAEEDAVLDRLGGVAWQSRKARLKQRIADMADRLIAIAAERAVQRGETMSPQEGLYEEFCARFPYVETDDQLQAISDVLDDLSSGKPMDRLICGDVGFRHAARERAERRDREQRLSVQVGHVDG